MKNAIKGFLLAYAITVSTYAYMLHTGEVVSVKAACAESAPVDLIDALRRAEP